MVKIIKNGQKDFIAKCSTCGCEFSYQLIDINLGSVMCPYCGCCVGHKGFEEPFITGQTIFPYNLTRGTWIPQKVAITSSNTNSQFDSLQAIHDLCIGYDGFNTVEGLKSLIDDICAIADEIVCKEKEE